MYIYNFFAERRDWSKLFLCPSELISLDGKVALN